MAAGASISGSALGSALSFILPGPVGAAIGGGVGALLAHTLCSLGEEIDNRLLAPRERTRVGATLAFAAENIQERLKKGEHPRDDGFFDTDASGRSSAEEIGEGVLLTAQREHEEKKLKYLGLLLAHIYFDKSYDKAQANFLISLAERLTYTQYMIISLIGWNTYWLEHTTMKTDRMQLRNTPFSGSISDPKLVNVLTQIVELIRLVLVEVKQVYVMGPGNITPADLRLTGVGADFWNTTRVQQLRWDAGAEDEEFKAMWRALLRGGADVWNLSQTL